MNRTIIVLALLFVCAAVFAAQNESAMIPVKERIASVDRELPTLPEPPRIMDDTLQYWNFETAAQRSAWSFVDASDIPAMWHPDTVPGRGTDSAWWCADRRFLGYGNYWYQAIQTPMLNLTGTTNPTLACKLWYSFELPGTSTGYDGVTMWISTNGGATFSVLTGPTPAYNGTSLNAASGVCWNLGTVPGYTGFSGTTYPGGYQITTASLTNFRRDSIVVRWTVLSDRAISAETRGLNAIGIDSLFGCFLDSVRINDGTNTLFSDNGGHRGANTLQTPRTRGIGQHWEWSNVTYNSPTYSAHTNDNYPSQQACLVSPPITIPTRSTYFTFSVLANMLDTIQSNPPPIPTNAPLRHYYVVEAQTQTPDTNWHWMITDYMRGGHGAYNWFNYYPDSAYNGNHSLNLTQYAGQTIHIRFRMITDYDTTRHAPTNPGLWIDDFRIMGDNRTVYDVEPLEMHIPFPTTVQYTWTTQPFVRMINRGRGSVNNLVWSIRSDAGWVDQTPIPVAWFDSTWQLSFNLPMTTVTTMHPAVRITMPTTPVTYKTLDLGDMQVLANGSYELGYDSRHFWISDTLSAAVTSYAEKFTPASDNYSGSYNVRNVRFATKGGGAGSVRVKLMTPAGARPGAVLVDTLVTVAAAADSIVAWHTIDLSARGEAQNQAGNVYIVLQREGATNMPCLAADTVYYGIGHCYTWAGGTVNPSNSSRDYAIRMTIDWVNGVPERISATLPTKLALSSAPNPFNPSTRIAVDVPNAGSVNVAIYDLNGRVVENLFSGKLSVGSYRFAWNASRFASGVYFVKVNTGQKMVAQKITLLK